MRSNLLFFLVVSNANLKPGGLLKQKKQLVKGVRLLLLLIEVIKIIRLTSLLSDMARLSSPRPRLKAWKATCPSLFLKSNPKSVCFLLCSVAGSSSSSPNFPNCFPPRESASAFANYLRSHFCISQSKDLHSKAKGYLSELRRAMSPKESCSFFSYPLSPPKFLTTATNLSSSTSNGLDKVTYPMLKHLPHSGMNFLLHIFNLS